MRSSVVLGSDVLTVGPAGDQWRVPVKREGDQSPWTSSRAMSGALSGAARCWHSNASIEVRRLDIIKKLQQILLDEFKGENILFGRTCVPLVCYVTFPCVIRVFTIDSGATRSSKRLCNSHHLNQPPAARVQ